MSRLLGIVIRSGFNEKNIYSEKPWDVKKKLFPDFREIKIFRENEAPPAHDNEFLIQSWTYYL